MKRFSTILGIVLILAFLVSIQPNAVAQGGEVRASLKGTITQRLGTDTDITIDYSRPGVKGRKIWGELVPFGLAEGNRYSDNKPYPWRAGANENTTIEFTSDLMIDGHKLPAGKYGIHMIPSENDWTVIFSKVNDIWGSYKYNTENDALRITVKPVEAAFTEWLTFGFEDLMGTSAVAFLCWEKLKVPFKVELAEN